MGAQATSTSSAKKDAGNKSELSTFLDSMSLRGDALERKILKTLDNMPAMPRIIMKARRMMQNPQANYKEFERALEADQGIATRVLRLANSAYYGVSGTVSSIQRASVILGYQTIGELVLVTSTSDLLDRELKGYGLETGAMWKHAMAVSFGARKIAISKKEHLADDAFTAGLIHDVGKLILNKYLLERKSAFEKYTKVEHRSLVATEKKLLGLNHAEIAAKVCEKWNFPESIYVAIGFHHDENQFRKNELACIINVADQIAKWYNKDKDKIVIEVNKIARKVLDVQAEELRQILHDVTVYVDQVSEQMIGV